MKLRFKRKVFFSNKIMDTRSSSARSLGFNTNRKYDTDLDRLSRGSFQKELRKLGDIRSECRKLGGELHRGISPSDLRDNDE